MSEPEASGSAESDRRALLDEADAHLGRLAWAALDLLHDSISKSLPTDPPAAPPLPAGTVLGDFRVVRELGRGGMGTVYLAERSEEDFRHRVAVKVLRRGLDSEDVLGRFNRERQILASMRHPGITPLVGGGTLPDGRPYFAMELVEGRPIDQHCEHAQATLEERLDLFLQVTDAVEYAHRHLVVHRDLKPSNILVSSEGHVRLLDFGIAKILEADEAAAEQTQSASILLTPAYASPEQLRGGLITTASDIYQLGLLLHRILTGDLPLSSAHDGQDSRELHPPSATPAALAPAFRRRLKGDIDAIVQKALRPDPEDRYASVGELAADIRRFLRGHPVSARRGSRRYLVRRFVSRNRIPIVAVSGLALGLALYGAGITRERDRARMEAHKADQVMGLLVSMFESVDPDVAAGRDITVREVLNEGVSLIGDDLPPEVTTELVSVLGGVYQKLGLFGEARPLLTRAIEGRDRGDPRLAVDMQQLALATQLADQPLAIQTLREALAEAETTHPPGDPLIAAILVDLANLVPGDERQPLLDRAFGILRSTDQDVRRLLAHALTIQAYSGPPELAERRHREALALRKASLGDEHFSVATSLADLATTLELSDPAASDSLHRDAIAILTRTLGPAHNLRLSTLNNYAAVLRDRGEYAAAEPLFREVLAHRREAYPDAEVWNVYPLYGLGWVLAETGRPAEAEPLLQQVIEVLNRHFGEADPRVQAARSTLGRSLALMGRNEEAEALLLGAYAWERENAGEPAWARTAARLTDLYDSWGRPAEAARFRDAGEPATASSPAPR